MAPNPQSLIPNPDLDQLVRRVDEDRWLASRFAPPDVRARLIALYAVNYEIARTAEVVREAPLGAIRLQWWRDALEEMQHGAPPRDHPALQALAHTFPAAASGLQGVAAARLSDFESEPFATWRDFDNYVDATAVDLMRLAVKACVGDIDADLRAAAEHAARVWGYVGLLRAEPVWRARARALYPREGGGREDLLTRAEAACATLRTNRAPPSAAFPALGYAALCSGYLRALRAKRSEPSLLSRQFALIAAAATGRL